MVSHPPRLPLRMVRFAVPLVCFIGLACARGHLGFSLTYKDAQNLRPGQFLVYRGMRIGEVANVTLRPDRQGVKVDISVGHGHAGVPYREASYVIESPQVVNVAGEKQITMKDAGSTRTAVVEGDVLAGSEGMLGALNEQISQIARSASELGAVMTQRFNELGKTFQSSPEMQDLKRGMQDLAAEAARRSREEFDSFRKQHMPELKEKAMEYRKKLEKEGKIPEAKEFWDQFTKWLDAAQKA